MAISIDIELEYEFSVKASAAEAMALLSDLPACAKLYPKVDRLVDLGDGAYRWEMEKIGVGSATIQTIYASKYVPDKAKGTVVWTPVKGEGNAQVAGNWKITAGKKCTQLKMQVGGTLTVPLPGLMKMVVAPVVKAAFEKLTDDYVANLTKKLGGAA
ncbi:MAG: SRPBCC family protein [Burkholderiales bacterium]